MSASHHACLLVHPPPIITFAQYYCSVGGDCAYGREVVDEALEKFIYAGLQVSGINAEVAPGQWEYQIGPAVGISSGDQMWISRYIINRVAEKYGYAIDYRCKPLKGDWNGSGCHTNVSTAPMRAEGGLAVIKQAMEALGAAHKDHMKLYGDGNEERMTGAHETASYDKFSFDVANRCVHTHTHHPVPPFLMHAHGTPTIPNGSASSVAMSHACNTMLIWTLSCPSLAQWLLGANWPGH